MQDDPTNSEPGLQEPPEKADRTVTRDLSSEEAAGHKKELPQRTVEDVKMKKRNARVYRWKLVAGLFLPYFLASTDVTSKSCPCEAFNLRKVPD